MKTIDPAWAARLSGGCTTLARLVEFVLLNGNTLYLTDSDRAITVGTIVYQPGAMASQIQLVRGTSTQSGAVNVLLGAVVTNAMIEGGLLDNAQFTVKVIDFAVPTIPAIVFYVGFVDKITYKDRLTAVIEGKPLSAQGVPLALDIFSMSCRADLGDSKCMVNIDALKQAACVVTSVTNAQNFNATFTDNSNLTNGLVVFTSGALNGDSFEVATAAGGVVKLKAVLPIAPAAGDTFTIYPGCDKTTGNCQAYNNIVNFQGEPFSVSPYTATVAPSPPVVAVQSVSVSQPAVASTTATTSDETDDGGLGTAGEPLYDEG